MTFKDDKVEVSENNSKGTFKLDDSKTPKEIDMNLSLKNREITVKGIYELDGDTLKICFTKGPDGKRPTKFATSDVDGNSLINLKREKPEKPEKP